MYIIGAIFVHLKVIFVRFNSFALQLCYMSFWIKESQMNFLKVLVEVHYSPNIPVSSMTVDVHDLSHAGGRPVLCFCDVNKAYVSLDRSNFRSGNFRVPYRDNALLCLARLFMACWRCIGHTP